MLVAVGMGEEAMGLEGTEVDSRAVEESAVVAPEVVVEMEAAWEGEVWVVVERAGGALVAGVEQAAQAEEARRVLNLPRRAGYGRCTSPRRRR